MFNKLFGKKENHQKTNVLDFDELIDKVKRMPEQEGQIILWKETFGLEKWHFIAKPDDNVREPKPFIGEVDGRGWMYLFTDGKHAREFGEVHGLLNNNGDISTLAMEPKIAVDWLCKWAEVGVFGLRFNEGNHGWFAPITNLKPMMEYLKI
jgi:hypothetical protein